MILLLFLLCLDLFSQNLVLDLSQVPNSEGINLRIQDGESLAVRDKVSNWEGYRPTKNLDPNRPFFYMYFDVTSPNWISGAAPYVILSVQFIASESGQITIEYDSSDSNFRGSGEPGVWKPSEGISFSPSPQIQVLRFALPLAYFNNRCNGADFRLTFNGKAPLVHQIQLQRAPIHKIKWQRYERLVSEQPPVYAAASVMDFGAKGDGLTPDDEAFNEGLLTIASLGGGVLFVPPGRYLLTKPLVFPSGTGLQGVWKRDWARSNQGSVLMLDIEKGFPGYETESLPAALQIGESGSLRDMVLWHPQLKSNNIRAFPWMIVCTGGNHLTLENLTLVNPWKGIRIGPSINGLHIIRNVDMTALQTGIEIDHVTDIGRIENLTIAPQIWTNSRLPDSPAANGPHESWIRQKAIGVSFYRSDWQYTSYLNIRGYNIGIQAQPGPNGMGNGHWYAINLDDVETGLLVKNIMPEGFIISHSSIKARQVGVKTLNDYTGTINFWETDITAPVAVELGGTAEGALQGRGGRWLGEIKQGRPSLSLVGISAPTVSRQPQSGLYLLEPEKRESNTPQRQVSSRWEKNPRATGRGFTIVNPLADDATLVLQTALNQMAATGGVVFLPPGTYRITAPLTIPRGVELRGALDWPRHHFVLGTVLFIDMPPSNEQGKALITLQSESGIRGITFRYPFLNPRRSTGYPPTIQTNGQNCWIRDINAIHTWWFIDGSTFKSDNLWIDGVQGVPIRYGITLGGGSVGQVVRNAHFNPHYAVHPRLLEVRPDGRDVDYWGIMNDNLEPFVLMHTQNAFLFHNFVFGSKNGLVLRPSANGRGASGVVIGHGTDGSPIALTSEGTASEGVDVINSQFVSMTSKSKAFIVVSGSSQLRLWNTTCWGQPLRSLLVEGGNLLMYLTKFATYGPFDVLGGTALVDQVHLSFNSPNSILRKNGEGNLLIRNGILASEFPPAPNLQTQNTLFDKPLFDPNARAISVLTNSEGGMVRQGLTLREKDGESELSPVVKDNQWGWASIRRLGPNQRDYYAYILVDNPGFKQGTAGSVQLKLKLWSPGSGRIRVVYDSRDQSILVNREAPGAWKEAGVVNLQGARGWREFTISIRDPLFAGRCNGADIRLEIVDVSEPLVIGSVEIIRQ